MPKPSTTSAESGDRTRTTKGGHVRLGVARLPTARPALGTPEFALGYAEVARDHLGLLARRWVRAVEQSACGRTRDVEETRNGRCGHTKARGHTLGWLRLRHGTLQRHLLGGVPCGSR